MLLRSKFLPPAVDTGYRLTPELAEALEQILDFKITALLGSPGYGKSTAIAHWLQHELAHHEARLLLKAQSAANTSNTPVTSNIENSELIKRANSRLGSESQCAIAWLSLDGEDNDSRRFWQYLSGALYHAGALSNTVEHEAFFAESDRQIKSLITGLLNALDDHGQPTLMVLDDYDLIKNDEIHEAFAFFIDYLPVHARLILTSRFRPTLNVARWRVSDDYQEILPEQFALNQHQTVSLFNQTLTAKTKSRSKTTEQPSSQVEPDSDVGQTIFAITQGWPVGIKLLALSCCNQPESISMEFLQRVTRECDLMGEYFLGEVVSRLPKRLADFLYYTAHLTRINRDLGDLCFGCAPSNRESILKAEEGDEDYKEGALHQAQACLEYLAKEGIFLEVIDREAGWYRYHSLFQQFLRSRAERELPQQLPQIRIHSATWLKKNGYVEEALEQVLQLGDWEWAAQLMEQNGTALLNESRYESLKRAVLRLPSLIVEERPKLVIFLLRIWIFEATTHINPTKHYLQLVESRLQEIYAAFDIGDQDYASVYGIQDLKDWYRVHGEFRFVQSFWARLQGRARYAETLSRESLELAENKGLEAKAQAHFGLGMSLYLQGSLREGAAAVANALQCGQQECNFDIVVSSAVRLAWVYQWQGEFKAALQVYQQTRAWLEEHGQCSEHFICWQNLMLVSYYRELNQLDKAQECLTAAYQLMGDDPKFNLFIPLVHARLEECLKNYEHAEQLLDEVEQLYRPIKSNVQGFPSVAAAKAKLAMLQGDQLRAEEWLDEWMMEKDKRGDPVFKSASYRHEEERLTAARVLLMKAQHQLLDQGAYQQTVDQVIPLLNDIEANARRGNRVSNGLTSKILLSIALITEPDIKRQDEKKALALYQSALKQGAKAGYVRLFIEELPMQQRLLLNKIQPEESHYEYAQQLLALIEDNYQGGEGVSVGLPKWASKEAMVEPLSKREMDVLQLMSKGLANKEIAERLFVGVGTVKTHVRNILGKLDVGNRTQAVAKAREVGVI